MEESRKLNNAELENVTGGGAETPPYFKVGRSYLHKTHDNWRYVVIKYLGYYNGDHHYSCEEQEYLNFDPLLPHPYPSDYRWYVTHYDVKFAEAYLKDLVRG